MKAKRRRHDPEFKARVALEALKGIKTIQQIAKDYEVHPVQVSDWKKTIQEGVAGMFERACAGRGEEEFERERDQLNPTSRTRGKKRLFSGFNGSGMRCFTGGIPAKGLVVPTHPLARRFAGVIG
jgi:transposase/putative transposase